MTTRSVRTPTISLRILGLVLVGFAISPIFNIEAVWVAAGGALLMSARALSHFQVGVLRILRELNLPFLVFVAGLAVVVVGATSHGIQEAVSGLLPTTTDLLSLLAVAGLASTSARI